MSEPAFAKASAGRLLLGPGPSPVSPRVMRAMAAPVLSHLDPDMMAILDEVRARLGRVFRAGDGAFSFAVSGTGTSGMEIAVANLARPGARAIAIVNGYFGDRLAQMLQRYGRIWRVGLMGSGSTQENVTRLVSALARLLRH